MLFGLLIALPTIAVGGGFSLLLAAAVADDLTGCGSVDPTDPANYAALTIVNDTASAVVVDQCEGGYCVVPDEPQALAPGASVSGHAACGATGADMTSWRVTTPAGALLGYVAVDSPRSEAGLIYAVSAVSADRRTATPHT